ncbi:general secretion pathway protein K [Candidatus Magnetomoraceae bacterium gMMP-15]
MRNYKLPKLKNNQGVVLLMALGITAVLVVVVLQANMDARFALEATAVTRDRHMLTYNDKSGISIAAAMLINSRKKDADCTSMQQDWADPLKIREVLAALPPGAGKPSSIKITDEKGKIQINALTPANDKDKIQDALVDRFIRKALELLVFYHDYEADIGETRNIIQSLQDWLDNDNDTRLSGAEEDYYESNDKLYTGINSYFADIEEMRRVKGITNELFNFSLFGKKFSDSFTVFGSSSDKKNNITYDGKININTAEGPVLWLLFSEEDEDRIQDIIEYREERVDDDNYLNNICGNKNWYKSAFPDISFKENLITTQSNIFRVVSTTNLGKTTKTISAVLEIYQDEKTKKWKYKILIMKDKS